MWQRETEREGEKEGGRGETEGKEWFESLSN